jgi:hypothetical protein
MRLIIPIKGPGKLRRPKMNIDRDMQRLIAAGYTVDVATTLIDMQSKIDADKKRIENEEAERQARLRYLRGY